MGKCSRRYSNTRAKAVLIWRLLQILRVTSLKNSSLLTAMMIAPKSGARRQALGIVIFSNLPDCTKQTIAVCHIWYFILISIQNNLILLIIFLGTKIAIIKPITTFWSTNDTKIHEKQSIISEQS